MQIIYNQKHLYLKTKSAFADHELSSVGSVQTIHAVCPKHTILAKEKQKHVSLKYKVIVGICVDEKKQEL